MPCENDREEGSSNAQASLRSHLNWDRSAAYARGGLRLSTQGKLTLGVLVATLPAIGVTTWMAWRMPALWVMWLCGLLSLALGLGIVFRANRPLSDLAGRARASAGVPAVKQRLFGLIRTDPSGDQMISDTLDKIEQSLQEIQALNRIGQLVASDENLKCILTAIIEEAVALLKGDAGLVGSWDDERMVFRDMVACNLPIMFRDKEFGINDCFASEVACRGELLFLDNYLDYSNRIIELDRFGLRAALGAPMTVRGRSVGTLVVLSTDPARRFTLREGQLLATFASQAGAAFEKARLHQLTLSQLAELSQAKEELARKSRELEQALSYMVKVQEEERARIAADVHDGVVQIMVGSLCELQAAMAHYPRSPDLVKEKQEKARKLIRESITELRRVIFDLRPITLDVAGLVPAIQSLREDLHLMSGLQMEICVTGLPCRLPPATEISAYRIIQEAVNNVAKHAQATCIEVGLRFEDEVLEISVRDDGRGFSVEEATLIYGKHAGLIGMRERVRSLGGKLSVSSTAGQGTSIKAVIPCRATQRVGL